ncbi:hypothetical protein [Flavobacterium chungangense]|uniref:Uncharacterized protein n=1 Tax=Flavobacterium chungangense TaxID=554283 RepID=A0A6V6YRR0_9FLAO|nr:hypothetical protein [Flavobacterium chungangense]CAD0002150.1 hypothetical protein FLACHUCJ7_00873 [Flavobacterium chungangense]
MENLINQENLEDIREFIENKIADVPANYILYGAIGSLLLSSYLKKIGKNQASSVIGKLSIPIIAIGLAKYKDVIKSELKTLAAPQPGNA